MGIGQTPPKGRPIVVDSDSDDNDGGDVVMGGVETKLSPLVERGSNQKTLDVRRPPTPLHTPAKQSTLTGFFKSQRDAAPVPEPRPKKTPAKKAAPATPASRPRQADKQAVSSGLKILPPLGTVHAGGGAGWEGFAIGGGAPPLSDLAAIFDDIVYRLSKTLEARLFAPGRHRKVRVATMCSGTESPLLALDLMARAMKKRKLGRMEVEHVFSCEIEPFKQAYIERNFAPPILFRDIRELGGAHATTAYGAVVPVPGDVDLLVAGTSCVDFSNLNTRKKSLDDGGESGDTFHGMMAWVRVHRPRIVIQENVVSADWELMRQEYLAAGYSAEFSTRIDTKHYYLPQTRTRGYLFAVARPASDLPDRWLKAMIDLKRPATADLEAFLLRDDDTRVVQARTELARVRAEDRAGDWESCHVRHSNVRVSERLGDRRPLLAWVEAESTLPHAPEWMWREWLERQRPRVWDWLEIRHLEAAARSGFDAMHKAYLWELSQNVDRAPMGRPNGISMCLTPGMIPFLPLRGRPVSGLECLALQGLPIDELLLTRESSDQLKDLAGNAMSSTVVGTAVLAALCLCADMLPPPDDADDEEEADIAKDIRGDTKLEVQDLDLSIADAAALDLAALMASAESSAKMCVCEGTAELASQPLQKCTVCGHTSCTDCGRRPTHVYELLPAKQARRLSPREFEHQLKAVLPMRLRVSGLDAAKLDATLEQICHAQPNMSAYVRPEEWKAWRALAAAAIAGEFRFTELVRREVWTAVFEAPAGRLELVLAPAAPEWRLHAKCARTENKRNLKYARHPIARMVLPPGAASLTLNGNWELYLPISAKFPVKIEGVSHRADGEEQNLVAAWENKLGILLEEFVDKKVWSRLRISVPDNAKEVLDVDIAGEYTLSDVCGTARNALHRKVEGDPDPNRPLFFFMNQARVGDKEADSFAFGYETRRLDYGEERPLVAHLSNTWRQSDKPSTTADCFVERKWYPITGISLEPSTHTGGTVSKPSSRLTVDVSNCATARAVLVCRVPLDGQVESVWTPRWTAVDKTHERPIFSALAWLTERIRALPPRLSKWNKLALPADWTRCHRCDPVPPKLTWVSQGLRKPEIPIESPQEAAPYERALKNRPAPFVTHLRLEDGGVGALRIGVNAAALVHRALARLPSTAMEATEPSVAWRIATEYVPEVGRITASFSLKSNKMDAEHAQPPHFAVRLRKEQLRSLGWMIAREDENVVQFVEEEVVEALLPAMTWRAEGRVQRAVRFRGGVLADEVGYGKTATSLALIDCTQAEAAADAAVPLKTPGRIPTKATLIVVPDHLYLQWGSEIQKFLGSTYTVRVIESFKTLHKTPASDILDADIVVVGINGVWQRARDDYAYWHNLGAFAGSARAPEGGRGHADRRFADWHAAALRNLHAQVNYLLDHGPARAFARLEELAVRRHVQAEEEAAALFVQERRKKGEKYQEEKRNAQAGGSAPGGKRRLETAPEPAGKKARGEAALDPAVEKTRSETVADPWGLQRKDANLRSLTGLPLEAFSFNRIIVDEFTYAEQQNLPKAGVMGIAARARWILSGTPPQESFADIKTIADILGIHLGVDDDGELKKEKTVKEKMAQTRQQRQFTYKSAAEEFTAFREVRSPYWHKHRLQVAQRFLDHCVRQNKAEIGDFDWEDHIIPVQLPGAERAIYLELEQHVKAMEMKAFKRMRQTGAAGDRLKRLREVLGESDSPEEALLKRSSYFKLDADADRASSLSATQACRSVVATRKRQLADCREELRRRVRDLVVLKKQITEPADRASFRNWNKALREKQVLDDPDAQKDILAILDATIMEHGTDEDFKDAGLKQPARQARVKVVYADGTVAPNHIVEKEPPKKKGKGKAKSKSKSKPEAAENADDDDDGDDDAQELKQFWPETPLLKRETLRSWTTDARGLARIELARRHGSLRYFCTILALEQTAGAGTTGLACPACGRQNLPLADTGVLATCGHVGCWACSTAAIARGECIRAGEGCRANARLNELVAGSLLGVPEPALTSGARPFGAKMAALLRLVTHEIPRDEKVLVFVQFPELMRVVRAAFRAAGVDATAVADGDARVLQAFQNGGGRVLLMAAMEASASGANLTLANHVVFVAPLLADTDHQYHQAETQAIGRVRRYGQTRKIHIWRFLTLDTFDVRLYKERTKASDAELQARFVEI